MKLEIELDDALGSDCADLARILGFDLKGVASRIVHDALRNKIEDLKKEFE